MGRCTLTVFEQMFDHRPRRRMTSTPILRRGTGEGSVGVATGDAQGKERALRRYDDPVDVRKGAGEGPEQFLWRGRLWQVREVVAHWVETGAWWTAVEKAAPAPADPVAEREVWRVAAAHPMLRADDDDPGFGVFDLAFDWAAGSWQLASAVD